MMSQLPPKDTTHAEPLPGGNGEGDDEHTTDRAASSDPLDLADLDTQLPVPPQRLQRQQGERAARAERHEQRAAQLHREVARIQEAEYELAALEHELDVFWRTPSGLLSEENHQRIRDLSGLVTEQRQRLRHASEQMADWLARAQRHEAAAAELRAQEGHEQHSTREPEPGEADTRSASPAVNETGTTPQFVPPEVRATARAQREAWARDHEREAEHLVAEARALADQLETDRVRLRAANARYLAQVRAGTVRTADREALEALEHEVTACQQQVAADNEAIDACHKEAKAHRQVARDLRGLIWRDQRGQNG